MECSLSPTLVHFLFMLANVGRALSVASMEMQLFGSRGADLSVYLLQACHDSVLGVQNVSLSSAEFTFKALPALGLAYLKGHLIPYVPVH